MSTSRSPTAEPLQLSPLTCTLCKARKVRCDRILPRCGRCASHNGECNYPSRQKRKPNNSSKSRTAEIDALLDRLNRIESSVIPYVSPLGPLMSGSNGLASQERPSAPISSALGSPPTVANVEEHQGQSSWNSTTTPIIEDAIPSRMQDIVNRIMAIKRRKLFHALKSTEGVIIPPELARLWVKNYFSSMPSNMTTGFEHIKKLLMMIPDLMDQEYVQIEPAIMVLYYVILYHGCCLPCGEAALSRTDHWVYLEKSYLLALRSLPAWQRSTTGSTLDLSAAIMMTRAAVECHDTDTGYQMHRLACQYAEELNMHMLDAGSEPRIPSVTPTDAERREFWDLVQYDTYFRLILNKPSAFATPATAWKTNLPYLDTGLDECMNDELAVMFLFCSHVTLEVATFYTLLEEPENVDQLSLLPEIEAMSRKMQERYDEWQIDNILSRIPSTSINGWFVVSTAIASSMDAADNWRC